MEFRLQVLVHPESGQIIFRSDFGDEIGIIDIPLDAEGAKGLANALTEAVKLSANVQAHGVPSTTIN